MDRVPTEYERQLAMQPVRPLHDWEKDVLRILASAAGLAELTTPAALAGYLVKDMPDGGMGSIRFVPPEPRRSGRFGVSERWYRDADGTEVNFTLNLDEAGQPYEVDAWKVDNSPLIGPPLVSQLHADHRE